MTVKTIATLRALINAKEDRLSAISRRLGEIKEASRAAAKNLDLLKLDELQLETDTLGEEVMELKGQVRSMKAEINNFYRPVYVA